MSYNSAERDGIDSTTALRGSGGRRFGGSQKTLFAEVTGVRKAGGVTLDDADSSTAITTTRDLLHFAIIEAGRRRTLVLYEDFRKICSGRSPSGKHT
jgi:hypothetical protein